MKPGDRRLYRPVPRGFAETFVRVGWSGIEQEFNAHARTIRRWIDICGREGLVAARADHVRKQRKAKTK